VSSNPIVTAACVHCSKSFTYERLGKRLRKYCSLPCAQGAMKAKARARRPAPRIAPCEACGNPFEARGARQRFCSAHCRNRAYQASPARRASNLRPRPRVAPGSTSRSLRQRTFNRDGWRCQCCGCDVQTMHNGAVDSAVMRMLDSATSERRGLENAITLCRRCCGRLKLDSEIIAAVASERREDALQSARRLKLHVDEMSQPQAC
jgi:hypothetical protein